MLQSRGSHYSDCRPGKSDVWIDDCAITMANMHLMADSIGLGSCYINARMRKAVEGRYRELYKKVSGSSRTLQSVRTPISGNPCH